MKRYAFAAALVLTATAGLVGQQPPASPQPVFRGGVNLVLVDVVVRDRAGAPVKGLRLEDFELLEDGVRQVILTFAAEEITATAAPLTTTSTLSSATIPASAATRPAGAQPADVTVVALVRQSRTRRKPTKRRSAYIVGFSSHTLFSSQAINASRSATTS